MRTSHTIKNDNGFVTSELHTEGKHVYVQLGRHPAPGIGRMAFTPAEARAFAGHLAAIADEIDATAPAKDPPARSAPPPARVR